MASRTASATAVQHHQQFQHQHQLLLPLSSSDTERRGSVESAYYSIGSDRRASWQQQQQQEDGEPAWWDEPEAETCKPCRAADSVFCDSCEARRFQPTDKSPFHTRSHAEVVMEEFARLSGDRELATAATIAAAATQAANNESPLQWHPRPPQPSSAATQQPAVAALLATDPLPPLMEEIPDSLAADEADGAEAAGSIGMVGRLNTISGDFRYKRRQAAESSSGEPSTSTSTSPSTASLPSAAAAADAAADPVADPAWHPPSPQTSPTSAQTLVPTAGSSKRKFSLDARTVTTPSWGGRPGQLRLRPAAGLVAAASSGSRLFRLFHKETTPEQMAAFNQERRNSAAKGSAQQPSPPPPPDQNPSRMFRRFPTPDDDYFVALKVEESDGKEAVCTKVQERQKLLSVNDDGRTVVTEVTSSSSSESPVPADTTDAVTSGAATNATCTAASAAVRAPGASESEIEIALRLAKTSPFAYVPPRRLQPAPLGDRCRAPAERRPSAAALAALRQQQPQQQQQQQQQLPRRASEPLSSSRGIIPGGSRVKQLMAKFGGGES